MSETVIRIDNLSKRYRLGVIGGKRLVDDVNRYWARLRGRPDPLSKVTSIAAEGGNGGLTGDEIWALKDVSFEVKRGEVLGIIGRNGAGKSTLLKILSRVTAPTRGEVRVRGRIASLLEVGTGFHPELTGRENIYLNGAILGMTKDEISRKFDEIVAFSEVEKFIDTPVKRYSSGMYVRLAFAVAAHLEPEILIVDEVLAVGDAAFQERCLGKMRSVASEGRTVLIVSHNMSSIQNLCGNCILMKNGGLHASGPTNEVVTEYLSASRQISSIDIKDWKDRTGSGEARIVRFTVMNDKGVPETVFPLGSSVCFKIEVEIDSPVNDPCFGVTIHGPSGEPVIDLRSFHDGFHLGRLESEVAVHGSLDRIGLYPGRYFLSAYVSDSTVRRDYDYPKMFSSITVVPAPGKWGDLRLDPRLGKFHVDSIWSLSE